MRKVGEAWNSICTEFCHANPPLSVNMAPKLRDFGVKNKQLPGYYALNKAHALIQFAAKLFQSLN